MRKIVIILAFMLLISCEQYSYYSYADKLNMCLSETMAEERLYECSSNVKSIRFCSYRKKENGFVFCFYNEYEEILQMFERTYTITSHKKLPIEYVEVIVDGTKHRVDY